MLGLLTCKRLLSQQWGDSAVPVLLVALEKTATNGCQHETVAQVWCNDAMHRLARNGQARRPLLQQLFESNPLLAARVRDLLGKFAKGEEVGAAQGLSCSDAFSYASLYVVLMPCYLEASDFGDKPPLNSDGKTGYSRFALLPKCFCGAPSDSTKCPSYTHLKGARSVPALLLQFSSSPPSELLSAAPSSLLRQRSVLIQPTASSSLSLQQQSANIALKNTHNQHLSLPPTPGASSSNGMQAFALPMPTTHAIQGLAVHPSHDVGLSVGPFCPSSNFLGAISANAISERRRCSLVGGFGGAAVRSETAGGRTLRERRNSLVLAVVPLAVTIFALPSGAVLHQNAASMDYYGDRTSIAPPSRAPPGAAIPPQFARPNNSMPALQALLESAFSEGRRACTFDGDGDGRGDGRGGSVAAGAGAADTEADIAGKATLEAPDSGKGGGAAELHVAAAACGGREAAAGSASQENMAFLSTCESVHLVLPAADSHAGVSSVVQGGPSCQTTAATTAMAAAVASGRLAGTSSGPAASACFKAGHVDGLGGSGGDGGVPELTGPEFDVLRKLFALDLMKLDRMLAAVAVEGEVWQGIVRVPYSLCEESAQVEDKQDDDEGASGEDEAEEVGASGHGAGVFAARPYRPGEARAGGRANGRDADPDDSDDLDVDNMDIMASIPIDVQEAMSLVTADLNQHMCTGSQVVAAVPSTAGLSSVTAAAVAVTATESAEASKAWGREVAGVDPEDGLSLRQGTEPGPQVDKEAGVRRREGASEPAASLLPYSQGPGDVVGTTAADRTREEEEEEEPAASAERGHLHPSGASGAAGGADGGESGGDRIGDGGASSRLGPFTGDTTVNGERSKTEPNSPCGGGEIQTGGITSKTSLGTADPVLRRQHTGLCLTQEPDISTRSAPFRPQPSRPRLHRSASAFSLHFARLFGKSSSSNADASGRNTLTASDRGMSVAAVAYSREGAQGQPNLAWGFVDVHEVGGAKPYRAVAIRPAGVLPQDAPLQLNAAGGAGGGAGLQQPPQQHQQALRQPSLPQQPRHLRTQLHTHAQGQRQGSHSSSYINVPVPSSAPQRISRPTVGRILASLSRSLHLPVTAATTATTFASVAPMPIMSSTSAGSSTFTGMVYGGLSPDDAVRMSWMPNSVRSDGSPLEAAAATAAALVASTQAPAEVGLTCSPQTAAALEARVSGAFRTPAAANGASTSDASNVEVPTPLAVSEPSPAVTVSAVVDVRATAKSRVGAGGGAGAGTVIGREGATGYSTSRRGPLVRCLPADIMVAGASVAAAGTVTFPTVPEESASGLPSSEGQLSSKNLSTDLDSTMRPSVKEGSKAQKLGLLGRFLLYTVDNSLRRRGGNGGNSRGTTATATATATAAGTGRGKGEARAGADGVSEGARSCGLEGCRPNTSPNQRAPDRLTVKARGCRRQESEFARGSFLASDDETAVHRSAQSCLVTRREAGAPLSHRYGRYGAGHEPYGSTGGGRELGGGRRSSALMPTTMVPMSGLDTCDPSIPSSPPPRMPFSRRQSFSQRRSFHAFNGLATSTWQVLMSSNEADISAVPQPVNEAGGVAEPTEKDGRPEVLSQPQAGGSSAVHGEASGMAAHWDGRQPQQQQQQGQLPVAQPQASTSRSRGVEVAGVARQVFEDDADHLSLWALLTADDEHVVMAEGAEGHPLATLSGPTHRADRAKTTQPSRSQQLQQPVPQPQQPQYGNVNDGSQAPQQTARRHAAKVSLGGLVPGLLSTMSTANPLVVGAIGSTVGSTFSPGAGVASQTLGQPAQAQPQGQLSSSNAWARPQSSRVLAFASSLRTAPHPLAGPQPPTGGTAAATTMATTTPQPSQSPASVTSYGVSCHSAATSCGLSSAGRPQTQTGSQHPVKGLKGCRRSRSSLALAEMLRLQQQTQQQQQAQSCTDPSSLGCSASVPGLAHGGSSTLVAASRSAVPDLSRASAAAGEDASVPPTPLPPVESTSSASGAGAPAAAPPGPRDSLSQQPSRLGSVILRVGSSNLSKASWLTGPSPVMSVAARSASALTPKGGLNGLRESYVDGTSGDLGTEGPKVVVEAAPSGGAFAAAAAAAPPMLSVRPSLANASDLQPPLQECWHEVCATSVVDPETGVLALVLVQQDVTAKVIAERHVHQVAETEHRLLEQIFPRHVLQYITEESVLQPSGPSSHGVVVGGMSPGSLAAYPEPGVQNPGPDSSWRPQIRDCNRLATWHAKVTVLFADIQGFTPMCKVLPPRVVMAFLNTLFTRFDAMLDYYRVYKVETIGDCYMVAGGLIREDEDGMAAVQGQVDPEQASNVFAFARAMLRAACCVRLPTTGLPVKIRVGIHTGPVVSGVVGTRMPRFCLFGDTVNTASRMESTGVPGAIHASDDTYEMLCSESGWVPTGGIEVKGKGLMRTYLWSPPALPLSSGATTTGSTIVPPRSPNLDPPLPLTGGSAWSAASDSAPYLAAAVDVVSRAAARAGIVQQTEWVAAKAAAAEAVTLTGSGGSIGMPDANALIEQMEALTRSIGADASAVRGSGDAAAAVAADRRDGGVAQRVDGDGAAGDNRAVKPATMFASAPARRLAPVEGLVKSPTLALSSQDVLTIPSAAVVASTAAATAVIPAWKALVVREPQERLRVGDDADSAPSEMGNGGCGPAAAAATSAPEPERDPAVALDPSVVAWSQILNNALCTSRQRACNAAGTGSVASQSFSSANQLLGFLDNRQSLMGRPSSAQLQLQSSSPTRADQLPASVRGSNTGNSSALLRDCYASLKEWHQASS